MQNKYQIISTCSEFTSCMQHSGSTGETQGAVTADEAFKSAAAPKTPRRKHARQNDAVRLRSATNVHDVYKKERKEYGEYHRLFRELCLDGERDPIGCLGPPA